MSPLPLVWWLSTAEGPLARAEWSWPTAATVEDRAIEAAIVDAAAARLRADPRVADTGLRVDAGCARARCTLALDGLSGPLAAALPALEAAVRADAALSPAARRGLRKAWRRSWRVPGRVLEAAVRRVAEGERGPGAGPRPRLSSSRLAKLATSLRERAGARLELAGDLDPALRPQVEAWAARLPPPPPPAPPAAGPRPGEVLVVDWPGAARAQVALLWPSTPDDAVRDALIAGDFESTLVQRLREAEALTYDVEPLYGEGWAGAAFDVAPAAVGPALGAALQELAAVPDTPPERILGAHRRLRGRVLALGDTLAGQLAQLRLPPIPPTPPAALRPVGTPGIVVVGDAAAIGSVAPDATVLDRRTLLYGGEPAGGRRDAARTTIPSGQACRIAQGPSTPVSPGGC